LAAICRKKNWGKNAPNADKSSNSESSFDTQKMFSASMGRGLDAPDRNKNQTKN
jgi:hypothetical protein